MHDIEYIHDDLEEVRCICNMYSETAGMIYPVMTTTYICNINDSTLPTMIIARFCSIDESVLANPIISGLSRSPKRKILQRL